MASRSAGLSASNITSCSKCSLSSSFASPQGGTRVHAIPCCPKQCMKDQLPTVSFYHTSELLQAVVAIWSRLISYLNPHHENAENHSVIVEPQRWYPATREEQEKHYISRGDLSSELAWFTLARSSKARKREVRLSLIMLRMPPR